MTSLARSSGLRVNDTILGMNGKVVGEEEAVDKVSTIKKSAQGDHADLGRSESVMSVTVTPEQASDGTAG